MSNHLEAGIDHDLVNVLRRTRPNLVVTIDEFLRKGGTKGEVKKLARGLAKNDAPMTALAVDAYVDGWPHEGSE